MSERMKNIVNDFLAGNEQFMLKKSKMQTCAIFLDAAEPSRYKKGVRYYLTEAKKTINICLEGYTRDGEKDPGIVAFNEKMKDFAAQNTGFSWHKMYAGGVMRLDISINNSDEQIIEKIKAFIEATRPLYNEFFSEV
jgi:hypothetical protein